MKRGTQSECTRASYSFFFGERERGESFSKIFLLLIRVAFFCSFLMFLVFLPIESKRGHQVLFFAATFIFPK